MATKKTKEEKPRHPLMADGHEWDRDKVIDHICDLLATSSRGLGSILTAGYEGNTLPKYSTIMRWLEEDESLRDRYARAREAQADYMADEILDVADDARNDWMEDLSNDDGKAAGYRFNGEHVQRSRLRIDTRKWLASKLKPKKYGEKVQTEVTGKDGGPIEINDTERAAKIQAILAAAESRKGGDGSV